MDVLFITANSPFSQEVFKRVRPHIPRERWPGEPLRATFTPLSSGMGLLANFDDLPAAYAQVASRAVLQAGVDLVMKSPVALLAGNVVRAKRWRDAFLYFAVPLLFAIPLMGSLAKSGMLLAGLAFAANCAALLVGQIELMRRRMALSGSRFVAEVPVPGMRLHVASKS